MNNFYFKKDRMGRTALHHSAINGNAEIVELLIKMGASVNAFDKKDRRALHWASYMGHEEVVRILLESKAEVNCRDKDMNTSLHAVSIFYVQYNPSFYQELSFVPFPNFHSFIFLGCC